ncbi:OmpA family protein [Cytophaga aurantiaca]|uniref:OmpA family protein n=1 Tax=Cytophaga aurantiaca TaxID=29530 RepID=UPI000374B2C4|nr:OmpA family protein [Cytophaga aurantiaca]
MFKYSFIIICTIFLLAGNVSGQTGTKLDMFGASALSVIYDKNIIINGDFSNEYAGWDFDKGSGGYHIRYDGVSNPSDIQVGTNPAMFNKGSFGVRGFDTYGDHTTGNGNFLMVDGKCNSNYIKIWKQTVTIVPNTYYLFSIWVSSLKDNLKHPGILLCNIGGQSICSDIIAPLKGGATPDSSGGGWVHYEKIWFSDSISGSIQISIENNNTETCETEVDFGIDDIELKPVKSEPQKKTSVLKQFNNVLFETGSFVIDSVYFQLLNEVSKELKQNPTYKLYIKGYTDAEDTFEKNLDLSKQRAEAVKNDLISKGIDAKRIRTNGFGETRPVDTNDTPEGRVKNRRAEIYILQ